MATETVTVRHLTGQSFVIPIVGNTVREFCLLNAKHFGNAIEGNNFIYALFVKRSPINTFDQRHFPIRKFIKNGDELFSKIWTLGGPPDFSMYKLNLLESNLEREDECPLCLEKFPILPNRSSVATRTTVYTKVLDCGHMFHYNCLAKLDDAICPLCRTVFGDLALSYIKRFCIENK